MLNSLVVPLWWNLHDKYFHAYFSSKCLIELRWGSWQVMAKFDGGASSVLRLSNRGWWTGEWRTRWLIREDLRRGEWCSVHGTSSRFCPDSPKIKVWKKLAQAQKISNLKSPLKIQILKSPLKIQILKIR